MLDGKPIEVRFRPALRKQRGRLVSGAAKGVEVHAATFPRKRLIMLEQELLGKPAELARIFVHEVFHFAWLRLPNRVRWSYEQVLEREMRRRALGELGWSAESRKKKLEAKDVAGRTRRWREYVCESFCDTAAWLLGEGPRHEEFTLRDRFRRLRQQWFGNLLAADRISI